MHPFFDDYLERLQVLHNDFENAITGLSTEVLDWVPGQDMNSLCVLIVHTVGSTRYWVGDVAAGINSRRDRDAEFRAGGLDEEALRAKLADNRAFVQEVLATFTLDHLSQECIVPRNNQPYTVGWALLHALEHTSLHVGHAQITRQLWDQRR